VSKNELGHLIKMANQIASNIGLGATEDEAVDKVVNHISLFWARPMREKICAHMQASADDLNPIATKALVQIKAQL
jgi:formate dehydrogenase subunit delta